MSKASRRRAALVRAGYSASLLERLAAEGKRPPAAPCPLHPLAMISEPEKGRTYQRVPLIKNQIVYTSVWVPDEAHPLGGRLGRVVLHRRVNLRKDELPRWIKDRPLYEFTKESPDGNE